jgi:hypothetical protein
MNKCIKIKKKNTKTKMPRSRIPNPGYISKEMKSVGWGDSWSPMFVAALYTIGKTVIIEKTDCEKGYTYTKKFFSVIID